MKYKQVVIVLIGEQTASRPWVLYEIRRAYELGKPMMGIYIHGLKNLAGKTSVKGKNPFDFVKDDTGMPLSDWVPIYEPLSNGDSKIAYNEVRNNLGSWVETAIRQKTNS